MSQVDQVAGNLPAAVHVVVVDGITVILGGLIVDHHDRDAVFHELPALARTESRRADDDSVDPVLPHGIDNHLLAVGFILG